MNYINFPPVQVVVQGTETIKFPRMMKIRQKYDTAKINNLAAWVKKEMQNNVSNKDKFTDKRICITAGSRGIPDIDLITRTIVDQLKEWGAKPFIIPAMGSQGRLWEKKLMRF